MKKGSTIEVFQQASIWHSGRSRTNKCFRKRFEQWNLFIRLSCGWANCRHQKNGENKLKKQPSYLVNSNRLLGHCFHEIVFLGIGLCE